MRYRRPRRRGDWARRLTANMDPLSSDSDIFPSDSSCSSDSFSSHDNYLPRRANLSLPDLTIPISPPPALDIRDVAFAEYAAAELPDLAIFFRNIISPFASPSHPYSHRISSLSASFSDLSVAIPRSPRSPRSPRPPRDIPKSAALPPAFPDSARRPQSARHFPPRQHSLLETHSENPSSSHIHVPVSRPFSSNTVNSQSPPSSPSKLHRSRSAPIKSSAFPLQSAAPRRTRSMRPKSAPRQTSSSTDKGRSRHRSLLRRNSAPMREQSSSPRLQPGIAPSSQLSNSSSRPHPKKKAGRIPKIITTRRYTEDLELSAKTTVVSTPIRAADPDSFKHFFLIEKIHRWYSGVFLLTGERVFRVHMR